MTARALLFCLLATAGCARQYQPSARFQPPVTSESTPSLETRIGSIHRNELTWRLPNSHAQTCSDDAKEMRLELARAQVLVETRQLARGLTASDENELLNLLRSARDEFELAIVIARVLAAAGVTRTSIEAAADHRVTGWDGWDAVMREARAIHELG